MTTATLDKKIEQIGKILIQSERASTEGERDAFFSRAQELASQYSVELEIARQAVTDKEKREQPLFKRIQIGEPRKPLNAVFCELIMAIGRPQGLKFNIAHNSTYIIAFGFPSDIRIMEAMYAHISIQMVEEAERFLAKGEWKNDETWDERTWTYKPVHKRVARRSFYEAFISTIGFRLSSAAADKRKQETTVEETGKTVSNELVLRGKDVEVSDFYSRTSHARGTWKGSNNTYYSSTGASRGREAGQNARLGGQQGLPGPRTGIE